MLVRARSLIWALVIVGCEHTSGPRTADDTEIVPTTAAGSVASAAEPSAAEPSAAEPSAAEPSAAEPSAAEPSAAEPSTALADAPALDARPWIERVAIERSIAEADPRFAPQLDETGPVLATPGSARATFSPSGARLSLGGHEATLGLVGVGRAARRVPLTRASFEAHGVELRAVRGDGVLEWWRSLPSGLEHGVTISERPEGAGPLTIDVEVVGALEPARLADDAVRLLDPSGHTVARYQDLLVLDADDRPVAARMSVTAGAIRIEVDDTDARYPLVIDPLVVAEEATMPRAALEAYFGAVALSADGTRAVASGRVIDAGTGTVSRFARIFVRTGSAWATERTIVRPDGSFGFAVAISDDGTRAVVGDPSEVTSVGTDVYDGAARVYLRSGTTWSLEQILRVADTAPGSENFGSAVALSSDGSRAIVGAPLGGASQGGYAAVFRRSGTAWAPEAVLELTDRVSGERFGAAVSISDNAARAVVGVPDDVIGGTSGAGSARVFLRSGTVWTEEATLRGLTGTAFGSSVSIAGDGVRVMVGAPDDPTMGAGLGGARIFSRAGTVWSQEAFVSGEPAWGFGASVSLDADGNVAVAVARTHPSGSLPVGTVFVRSGTAWTSEGQLVTLGASSGTGGRDDSVAVSGDGLRAIVGMIRESDARVFTLTPAPNGTACSSGAVCASGLCIEGVCCNDACGNGATTDCRSCRASLTGATDGTCSPLLPALAAAITCRSSAGVCDTPEVCSPTQTTCPADMFLAATTTCGTTTGGGCDPLETCTGTSAACPADLPAPLNTVCRPATGVTCDAPEVCDGVSQACPPDRYRMTGEVCRAAMGMCDVAEVCNGSSPTCPGDGFAAAATSCRAAVDPTCDVAEFCTGTSGACPADVVRMGGTVCRAAVGVCDVAEVCNGTSGACPATDGFAAPSTMCRPAVAGGCDLPDFCTGTSNACPTTDRVEARGTTCRVAAGVCDVPETCDGVAPTCPANVRATSSTVCRAAADVCDRPETCTGSSDACPALDARMMAGTPCRAAVPLAMGGGCDVAEVCDGSSIACPADAFQMPGAVCRNAGGVCGVAETCSGASAACPPNGRQPAGTICRASGGGCDPAEVCSGASDVCPGDSVLPRDTPCGGTGVGSCSSPGLCDGSAPTCPGATPRPRDTVCVPAAAGNPCDVDDVCDGTTDVCAPRFVAAGTACGGAPSGDCDAQDECAGTSATCVARFRSGEVCRDSTGDVCDPAEVCGGASADCPADVPATAGTLCRASAGACDPLEACTGISPACPDDVRAAFGTVCRPAVHGTCDLPEACTGGVDCPVDRFADATTQCGVSSGEACDADDFCAGASPVCVDGFRSADVECRAVAGTCDSAERCSGTGPTCPPDAVEAEGMVCRASIDTTCDPSESCDGISATCPADAVSCADAGTRDGGLPSDAAPADAAASSDAGVPPVAAEGCSCRAGAERAPLRSLVGLAALTMLALARARRRRA